MMKDNFRRANWLFLFMAVWIIGFSLLGGRFFGSLSIVGKLLLSQAVYLLPVFLFVFLGKIKLGEWIPHGKIRVSTTLMTVLFTVLLIPLMVSLNLFTMLFSNNYVVETQEELSDIPVLLELLVIAVVPAISEEFMFRGVFFGAYRKRGILFGAVASGIVFGLFHLNFNQFGYALVLGISFAFLMEATGSIFYSMVGHFVINGWSVILSALSEKILSTAYGEASSAAAAAESLTREDMVNGFCVYAVIAAVCTCLAAGVYIWIADHSGRIPYLLENMRRRDEGEKVPVSPVFILGAVICAGFMIFRDFMAG